MVENSGKNGHDPDWEAIARRRVATHIEDQTDEYSAHLRDLAADIEQGKSVTAEDIALLWRRTNALQEELNRVLVEMATDIEPELKPLPERVVTMESGLHEVLWQRLAVDETFNESHLTDLADDTAAILIALQSGRLPPAGYDEISRTSLPESFTPLSDEEFPNLFDDDEDDDDENGSTSQATQ